MEDLQDKIIELMDLFDGEVTTADKIDRPQQALDRDMYKDFMDRNPMAGGGEVVIGKPGGLVQPETKFYAIKKTIKGTGDNAGNISTYVGGRDNQIRYIGSQEYIDKIRKDNPKFGKTGPTVHEQKADKAAVNKKAIKKNFKDNLGIDVEIGKNNLITGKGLTEELKKKIANAQSQYRKKNPGQAGLTNEGFWKYYSNIDKNKQAAATAAAEKEAAKMKAKDPKNIAELNRPLRKGEKDILYKSYDNIFKEEFNRLLNEGELFSKTDLNRAVINRIAEENPTIDLTKGTGLDKIPGGGNEESKTLFENIDKKFTTKQKANFTTNTNALAYTKNQDRLLQALLSGNTDFDDLAEELGFNEGRLKGNLNKLMRNLAYTEKSKQPLFFKKYSQEELENARNAVFNSPTLESTYQRTALQSILASTVEGSKQRKDALNKYKEFNKFKFVMKENGIDPKLVAMDHAASYRAIKNGNIKNFLAMTPIMSDINALKSTFDRRSQLNLRRMQEAITNGDNASYKKFLKNQTELEGIWKTMTGDQSSLGKIRIGATGKKKGVTKIFDYGATSILDKNKNLLDELGDNLVIRKNIVEASTKENLEEVSRIMFEGSEAKKPRLSRLPESFKNLNKPEMFKIENEIRTLLASFSANPKCRASFSMKDGGRINYATGPASISECAISGRNRLEKVIKTGVKLGDQEAALARQILRAGRSLGSAFTLSGLFGPAAIAFTAAAEAGIVGYDMLTTGNTLRESIGGSLLNYALGDKTKINLQEETLKRFGKLPGMTEEKLAGITRVLDQTNKINTMYKKSLDVENLEKQVKADRAEPKDTFMSPDDDLQQTDQAIRTEQKLEDEKQNLLDLKNIYTKPDPSGVSPFESYLKDYESGAFEKAQKDLAEANRLAAIQKLESRGPVIAGILSPKFEEGRQQDLLTLRSIINPASAFAIKSYENPESTFQPVKPFGLAGGGIAKLAGIDQGPQTESMNPDSQGLPGILKRGIKR